MTAQIDLETRLRDAVEALPKGLRDHVLRVEVEAERLAKLHDVDPLRARIAALGHDLVRDKSGTELLALASRCCLDPDDVERATPVLVHGPVAARILALEYRLDDGELLAGVDCHTTARAGMAALEKVLFIADKVEEEKLQRYPAWREVRDLAQTSLDRALLRFLDLHFEEAVQRRWLVHRRSLEARNELLLASS